MVKQWENESLKELFFVLEKKSKTQFLICQHSFQFFFIFHEFIITRHNQVTSLCGLIKVIKKGYHYYYRLDDNNIIINISVNIMQLFFSFMMLLTELFCFSWKKKKKNFCSISLNYYQCFHIEPIETFKESRFLYFEVVFFIKDNNTKEHSKDDINGNNKLN